MDGLNNNTINSFDLNYGNTFLFGDDLRNHNESRSTARVTPLTSPPYTSQECRRMSIDRMKDRQIAILIQKNNQLQMDVLTMQHQVSSHLPVMHEYGLLDQYGIGNNHLQLKLLTTALDEKSEELKQAKEEYDLIMKERATVHKEMREQACEIERLTRQNHYLQEQLRGNNLGSFEGPPSLSDELAIQLKEITRENEELKCKLSHQKRQIQHLYDDKEKTSKQLDRVVNHYRYLKKSFNQKRSITESKCPSHAEDKSEMLTKTMKVTDLKMALLNIVIDNSGDSDSGGSFKQLEDQVSPEDPYAEHDTTFRLRYDDRLLDIDGMDVTGWTDEQILDYLGRLGSGKYVKLVLSRPCGYSGTFQSWTSSINAPAGDSFGLHPLWLVTKADSKNLPNQIKPGDIIQMIEASDGRNTVCVVRLSSVPFPASDEGVDYRNRLNSFDSANEFNMSMIDKSRLFSPPVLPMKKKTSLELEVLHPISLDRLISVKSAGNPDRHSYNKSNVSLVSAPPIPPRSTTSLQCSFTENAEASCILPQDYTDLNLAEDSISAKLKVSVHSEFSGNDDNDGSWLSAEIMSTSFTGSGDFASSKMPKMGKCRNLILGIPSQVFNLKQLGLHLLHSKTDQYPASKSDVDISVVNQIFIKFIEPNSSARQAGLFEGDEILSINNQSVSKMTSEEAEHILLTNPLKKHSVKKEQKKLSLRIKVQFNPLKMYELSKERLGPSVESNVRFTRFTRSMYDDSQSGSFSHDKWHSHRLHVIRSSSNLNISESNDKTLNIVQHLLTRARTIRINMCTVLSQIKIMGGSAMGIFVSNIVYRDQESELADKESIGNRLALGDKIVEINGESYERTIGEDAVTSLNRFGHQVTLTVLYEPSGLLAINSDPFCQEHFYMEAMFSFSDLEGKIPSISNKNEKSTSLSTRLDNFGLSIYFINNYHLNFERGDILLVDATILPSNMTRKHQDNVIGNDWHASVVDRENNKIRSGMIPSAFWVQKMIAMASKSAFHRSPLSDKNSRFSMRSTPSSPKSDINTFISSNSTNIVSHACSRPQRHSSLSQKLFRRFSFRNSFHSTTTSIDETSRNVSFSKEMAFKPLKRIPRSGASQRPVILLGAHSETISMVLVSKWSNDFVLSKLKSVLESDDNSVVHHIISPVTIKTVSELHQGGRYPIVLLLKYKSAKEIRQLKIGKCTQVTVSKSDSFKLFSQIKEYENHWSHLISAKVTPNSASDSCQEIREMISKIQQEDIWLRVDRYQHSA